MSSTSIPATSVQIEKEEMDEVKIEERCLENKQLTAASSSSISEGSSSAIVKSPSVSSPATASPTNRLLSDQLGAKGGWTPEEDETLRNAVATFKGRFFPDRSEVQCLHRWQKVLNPELVKGPWTQEEDDKIIGLVAKYGPTKWSVIAKSLPGRIGKQCERGNFINKYDIFFSIKLFYSLNIILLLWHNHLNPDIKKEAWTLEEELLLMNAHRIHGNKWAEIAKALPGRTDNSIKNHWNSSLKKKLDFYLATGKLPPVPKNGIQNGIQNGKRIESDSAAQASSGTTDGYKLENDFKDSTQLPDMAASSSGLPNESADSEGTECKAWSSPVGPCYCQSELLQKCQNCEDSHEIGEGKVMSGQHLETPPYGSLCYEPPQLETCVAPTLDHSNVNPAQSEYNSTPVSSPVSFYTPPCRKISNLNAQSPESILRLAAKSYPNTPSIFRKRRSVPEMPDIPRKIGQQMIEDSFHVSDDNERPRKASNRTGVQDQSSDEVPNSKAFNASPPYRLRSKRTVVFKSVERQLAFTIDKEKHNGTKPEGTSLKQLLVVDNQR
ncbi:hypothetical protein K2173_002082 [Erythroxylum novogranatense]|uniref:Uncharacterized protein n=1 Tax=Erythroxylum novogranatense TaxID=1862640 RepID=A0AAV8SPS0_9ROSI|nr:hypothetical protein K2173_002082 [Erythroxylum novogranatense]